MPPGTNGNNPTMGSTADVHETDVSIESIYSDSDMEPFLEALAPPAGVGISKAQGLDIHRRANRVADIAHNHTTPPAGAAPLPVDKLGPLLCSVLLDGDAATAGVTFTGNSINRSPPGYFITRIPHNVSTEGGVVNCPTEAAAKSLMASLCDSTIGKGGYCNLTAQPTRIDGAAFWQATVEFIVGTSDAAKLMAYTCWMARPTPSEGPTGAMRGLDGRWKASFG